VDAAVLISIIVASIIILLIVGTSFKPLRWIGRTILRLGIGILILFFFNVIGGAIGLHIPINLFTAVVSGFLGLSGIASLAAIHVFII